MDRILIKTAGLPNQTMELRLGVNHVGRTPDNDFAIPHTTVSSTHCEFIVSNDGVYLRDCESTNGTFINGRPVREAWLQAGQEVRLGDVELIVESTEVTIAIPQYERPSQLPPPPTVLPDGTLCCPRHSSVPAVFRCTHCGEVMCNNCIHIMRRQGGAPLFLCTICSHKCERITSAATTAKKRGLLGLIQDTVKLKFGHNRHNSKK